MYKVLSIKYLPNIQFFVPILATLYLLLNTTYANAKALSLSIDPSIITINAIPPSTVTSNLTIQNKSENAVNLKIEFRPFKAKFENGELEYLSPSIPEYAKTSLMLKNAELLDNGVPVRSITLAPSQQKNLTLNVNIPENTNISDYYFSIVFISKNSLRPGSNASLNQLGIASNVLLSVGAKKTPNAILQEFSSDLFYTNGPVPFTVRVKNKGIRFITPKGEIVIKNMFDQSIGKLDLTNVNILSNSTRSIPNALWKENFLLGFYTATLNISLSNEEPTFTKSIHFFALPFQGLIVIVIILIAGIVIRSRLKVYMRK